MKYHGFLALLLLVVPLVLKGQAPDLELTLRYNIALSRYEVYALPDATQPTFYWGPSQISVLVPAIVPDEALVLTFVAGGAWNDNSRIYAPAADPIHDYHGIGSLGALTSLVANVEKLLFHFTLPGGGCITDLRLFINGVDPNSSAPGMGGGDFSNTVFAIVPGVPNGYEAYVTNYNNTGTVCTALPLELITFNAVMQEDEVLLQWLTAEEYNFDHFELERSEDAYHFITLDNIQGGNTKRYSYKDASVVKGRPYYYRLKIVDRDAAFSFSPAIQVLFKGKPDTGKIFPNPVQQILFAELDLSKETEVAYRLLDFTGRIVQAGKIYGSKGFNRFEFNVQGMTPGIYGLNLQFDNQSSTLQFLKVD
jgi:hypothetical protein